MYADKHGVTLATGTAMMQATELILRIVVALVWSASSYRLCYSAYAKKDQSGWQLFKTALSSARRGVYLESALLMGLLAAVLSVGFYTTLVTSTAPLRELSGGRTTRSLDATAFDAAYPGADIGSSLKVSAGLTDSAARRYEVVYDYNAVVQPATLVEMTIDMTTNGTITDSFGNLWRFTHPERWLCGTALNKVSNASTTTVTAYEGMSCLWDDSQRKLLDESGDVVEFLEHPRLGVGNSMLKKRHDVGKLWDFKNNRMSVTTDTMLGGTEPAYVAEQREYTYTRTVNLTDVEDLRSLNKNGEVLREVTYVKNSFSITKGQMRHTIVYSRVETPGDGPSTVKQVQINRTLIIVGDNFVHEGNPVLRGSYSTERRSRGPDDTRSWDVTVMEQSPEAMTVAWRALKYGVCTFRILETGYGHAYTTSILIVVASVAAALLLLASRRPLYETNSMTENLFTNNNGDIDDCASNKRNLIVGMLEAEAWAQQEIWTGTRDNHATVVVGDKILRAMRPPFVLQKATRDKGMSDMSATKSYWTGAEEEWQMTQTQPASYSEPEALDSNLRKSGESLTRHGINRIAKTHRNRQGAETSLLHNAGATEVYGECESDHSLLSTGWLALGHDSETAWVPKPHTEGAGTSLGPTRQGHISASDSGHRHVGHTVITEDAIYLKAMEAFANPGSARDLQGHLEICEKDEGHPMRPSWEQEASIAANCTEQEEIEIDTTAGLEWLRGVHCDGADDEIVGEETRQGDIDLHHSSVYERRALDESVRQPPESLCDIECDSVIYMVGSDLLSEEQAEKYRARLDLSLLPWACEDDDLLETASCEEIRQEDHPAEAAANEGEVAHLQEKEHDHRATAVCVARDADPANMPGEDFLQAGVGRLRTEHVSTEVLKKPASKQRSARSDRFSVASPPSSSMTTPRGENNNGGRPLDSGGPGRRKRCEPSSSRYKKRPRRQTEDKRVSCRRQAAAYKQSAGSRVLSEGTDMRGDWAKQHLEMTISRESGTWVYVAGASNQGVTTCNWDTELDAAAATRYYRVPDAEYGTQLSSVLWESGYDNTVHYSKTYKLARMLGLRDETMLGAVSGLLTTVVQSGGKEVCVDWCGGSETILTGEDANSALEKMLRAEAVTVMVTDALARLMAKRLTAMLLAANGQGGEEAPIPEADATNREPGKHGGADQTDRHARIPPPKPRQGVG